MFSATNSLYYVNKEYKVKIIGLSYHSKLSLYLLKLETNDF